MQSKPTRRWLQFSLRSLLLLMLLTAAFFGGRMSNRHEVERARTMELEAQRAYEAARAAVDEALVARQEAIYQAKNAQAQTQLREALLKEAEAFDAASSEPAP